MIVLRPSRFSSPACWQMSVRLPRGLIAHPITDRVAEVPGDVELVGRVPGGCRGNLHRVIVIVADSRPPNGNLAKDRLEGEGPCSTALDAGAAFALPTLQNQLLVGLFQEGLEESTLGFEPCLVNDCLDLVGEMLVLVGHGQSHLELELK